LDNDGNFLWAKKIGGSHYDNGYSLHIDKMGNMYATGYFMGTSDFNPDSENSNLTSNGDGDIFVMKLSQTKEIRSCFSSSKNRATTEEEIHITKL
ncbi:MAG: hypothetical protein U9R19_16165, partial [Bacteroidota bacterium]|nr:hypothetical protein [Bacteroidota bacterium]